jgi:hypothetical protein
MLDLLDRPSLLTIAYPALDTLSDPLSPRHRYAVERYAQQKYKDDSCGCICIP